MEVPMKKLNCACDRLPRLEGAATQAYISQFLEKTGIDGRQGQTHYYCRVCGRSWLKIESEDRRKSSLVRQEMEFNV